MASEEPKASDDDQDWRLEALLDLDATGNSMHKLISRLRSVGEGGVDGIESAVPNDVVVTHDGSRLFAYAASEPALNTTRSAIESVLRQDGIAASVRLSHWDEGHDRWQQTYPPPSPEETQREDALERDEERVETRTLVAKAGRLVKEEFEQNMLAWAAKLDLECTIIEHPHLLTSQIGFTVTGPKVKIDEFHRGLVSEGWMFVRTEGNVMLSPL